MKRRSIWMALFAPMAAAQAVNGGKIESNTDKVASAIVAAIDKRIDRALVEALKATAGALKAHNFRISRLESKSSKPSNNQCPVCRTMAPAYVRDVSKMTGCGPAECTPNGACFAVCRPWTVNDLPASQMVRCFHCNAAFWQDSQ